MEDLIQFIANYLDLTKEDIKPETNLRDLIDDSLEMIETLIQLEDQYMVDIPDEDIDNIITVRDLSDYLNKVSGQAGHVE